MRILYIVPYLESSGGIQEFAKNTAISVASGNEIKLLNWISPTRLREELIYSLLPARLGELCFQRFHRGGLSESDASLMRQFEIVHYWSIDAAVAIGSDLPSVITCHGKEILLGNVRHHRRRAYLKVLNNASLIHVNSIFTKNYLINNYNVKSSKIRLITPSLAIDRYKRVLKKRRTSDHYRIGTLSRLVNRKNITRIIAALSILKSKYGVKFEYTLAGTGPERKRLLIELKKSNIKYNYLGKISEQDKINKFYPVLDVFVLPPLQSVKDVEGFGIVYLEASASGVPVVASNTGGVSDAVRVNVSGLFADPTSPEDIAEKIYKILISKKDWSKACKIWARRFSHKKSAIKFEALYQNALE